MTTHDRDKIIAAAEEAGIGWAWGIGGMDAFLFAFYAIAYEAGRVAEREECEWLARQSWLNKKLDYTTGVDIANAIHARGDTK